MKAAQIYSAIPPEPALYNRIITLWRIYRTQGAEHIMTLSNVGKVIYASR